MMGILNVVGEIVGVVVVVEGVEKLDLDVGFLIKVVVVVVGFKGVEVIEGMFEKKDEQLQQVDDMQVMDGSDMLQV